MNLHPQFIRREGMDEYVVLPIAEYRALEDIVHDYLDLQELRDAKAQEEQAATTPLDEVMRKLEL